MAIPVRTVYMSQLVADTLLSNFALLRFKFWFKVTISNFESFARSSAILFVHHGATK